jgi:hypothetical protein
VGEGAKRTLGFSWVSRCFGVSKSEPEFENIFGNHFGCYGREF